MEKKMRCQLEIEQRIVELEERGECEDCYLDEGEQAELQTLYWVLGEDD